MMEKRRLIFIFCLFFVLAGGAKAEMSDHPLIDLTRQIVFDVERKLFKQKGKK